MPRAYAVIYLVCRRVDPLTSPLMHWLTEYLEQAPPVQGWSGVGKYYVSQRCLSVVNSVVERPAGLC